MTEITQADRDAAAECIRQGVSHPPLTDIISGKKDHWFFVQAFARHRIEATAALSAENERLREALRSAIRNIENLTYDIKCHTECAECQSNVAMYEHAVEEYRAALGETE